MNEINFVRRIYRTQRLSKNNFGQIGYRERKETLL